MYQSKIFQRVSDLTAFLNNEDSEVTEVVSITFDSSSGVFVLIYT